MIGYCPGIQAWYNLWVHAGPDAADRRRRADARSPFGLEEVWANDPTATPPTGLDGTTPTKFERHRPLLRGRRPARCSTPPTGCRSARPAARAARCPRRPRTPTSTARCGCPTAGRRDAPRRQRRRRLRAAHRRRPATCSQQRGWGDGDNAGLHTLQPYDAEMAKDGTVYMGLQDNGEGKIEPGRDVLHDLRRRRVLHRRRSRRRRHAYEEYTGGDISRDHRRRQDLDGHQAVQPHERRSSATPFQMDPANANHLMIGGRDVEETTDGPGTTAAPGRRSTTSAPRSSRATRARRARRRPTPTTSSPRSTSARLRPAAGAPTGPKTEDFGYTGGGTIPAARTSGRDGDRLTGTFAARHLRRPPVHDRRRTTATASMNDRGPLGRPDEHDWDLYLYKQGRRRDRSASSAPRPTRHRRRAIGAIPNPGRRRLRRPRRQLRGDRHLQRRR